MSTITLPNIRVGSDLQVRVRLKDGGVAIDWSTLSNIKACIYSDAQRALAGRCAFSIDEEDNTLLVCTYAANKPQYLGVNRIVISAKYMGETKTYDKPAFSFVRWTADQEGEEITIDDPDVDVEIDVEDVSSSILQEAVDAAFSAADRANEAAAAAEHMVDIHTGPEGKSAYEVAVEEGYTGTEEEWLASLVGPQGAQGIQGETGEAAGFGSVSAALQEDGGDPSVVVAASGEDTSKNFAFTFKNLKGDKGDKGDQGNTGSSVDYPYELVNNCTTDDATKGLAASQGVALKAEVSQLEAEVDGTHFVQVNLSALTEYNGYINAGKWAYSSQTGFKFVPVQPSDVVRIVADGETAYAVTTNDSHTNGNNVSFATGYSAPIVVPSGETTADIIVPNDGAYLFVYTTISGQNRNPSVLKYQAEAVGGLMQRVPALEAEVSEHIDLGNWNIGSIAPGPSSIPDYESTTRLRMKEQKAISKSGNYKITCANGYLFLIYVAGKISTATWTNNRTVSLDAGDIFRIAIKTATETDFSGYTQEQVNNVVSSANVQMTGGYIVQKMADDVADLSAKSNRLMADFSYSEVAIFNGTNAYCELNTPIVLSQNGDSIEITAIDIEATNGSGGGYAFGYGGSTSKIGIACGQTCRGWRADDGTWAGQADNIPSLGTAQIIKIEYADNKVYFSINGVAISISATQKTLTINGFGRTAPTQYGYWKGKIANIKHNGNDIYLSEVSKFYNVTFDKSGTHLTKEQQKAVDPKLMAKKSAGYLHIYRKNALNQYVHYVLMKRALEYSEGDYPSNYDVWEIVNIYLSDYVGGGMVDTLKLTAPSQYEIAINTPSAESTPVNRYVCGANHGFEKIIVGDNGREFRIMIDGEIVGEDATFDLKAINSVECIQHSEIFKAYSESDKIAEATKIWSISPKQELTIKMSVVFTASTSVHQMQMGMFGAYRRVDGNTSNPYLTNRAIKDSNPFKIYDVSDGWSIASLQNTDNGCFRITEYGEKGFGLSLIVLESNRTPNGGMFVNTNNGAYNKMYNDVTGDKSVSVSEEYHATVRFGVA